jgi:predicted HAD superfamily Cof-like phosphohydrolase
MEEQNFTSSNFKKMDDVSFTKLKPIAWEENSINELKVKKQVELNFSSGLRITIFE